MVFNVSTGVYDSIDHSVSLLTAKVPESHLDRNTLLYHYYYYLTLYSVSREVKNMLYKIIQAAMVIKTLHPPS